MEAILTIKNKLERPVTEKDKFYIVQMYLDRTHYAENGWIEKDFVEEDFLNKASQMHNMHITIIGVIEFTDRLEYEKRKLNFQPPR